MNEEIKKILKMLEEGILTAEEAEKLIDAVGIEEKGLVKAGADVSNRFLRVKMVENGQNKVNVNIPLSLIEVGLKIGKQLVPQFAPEAEGLKNIDFEELMEAIRSGAHGKLVEIEDGGDLITVEVD